MKGPWLAVVGAGRWQLHGIRCAQKAGLQVLAIDGDPTAKGLAIADKRLLVDIRDASAVVDAVKASGITLAGAISISSEVGIAAAARLREAFSLPGHGPAVFERMTSKAEQRTRWSAGKTPGPDFFLASNSLLDLAAARAKRDLGFPMIVKPVDAAGSRGVSRVDNEVELLDAIERAHRASNCGAIVIEEYIEGTEFAIESFSDETGCHILLITEKRKVPGTRGTVAVELSSASRTEPFLRMLEETVQTALCELGYTEGPAHTELIVDCDGQPFLVETGGRGGGFGLFDEMVPNATGFDLATACVMQAVGLPTAPCPKRSRRGAVLRFVASQPGRVQAIEGVDDANAIPGCHCEALIEPGHLSGRATSDGDRWAFIVTSADDHATALRTADLAEACLFFDVEALEEGPAPTPLAYSINLS